MVGKTFVIRVQINSNATAIVESLVEATRHLTTSSRVVGPALVYKIADDRLEGTVRVDADDAEEAGRFLEEALASLPARAEWEVLGVLGPERPTHEWYPNP